VDADDTFGQAAAGRGILPVRLLDIASAVGVEPDAVVAVYRIHPFDVPLNHPPREVVVVIAVVAAVARGFDPVDYRVFVSRRPLLHS
jgi:hypothetical protein